MVSRQYTPPTCTLEIQAKTSPLSRWTGQTVVKQLTFDLTLDDPRLAQEQRIKLHGDRRQLEALYDAISSYVQEFLHASKVQIESVLLEEQPSEPETQKSIHQTHWQPQNLRPFETEESYQNETFSFPKKLTSLPDAAFSPELVSLPPLEHGESLPTVENADTFTEVTVSTPATQSLSAIEPAGIYLQPDGLVAHQLFLGSLATPTSGPVIRLSVLQLFDLASALDEYAGDFLALPHLSSTTSRSRRMPVWASAAAMVLFTVGVAGVALKLQQTPVAQNQATSLENSENSQDLALQRSQPPSVPVPGAPGTATVPPPPPPGSIMNAPPSLPPLTIPEGVPTTPTIPPEPRDTQASRPTLEIKPEPETQSSESSNAKLGNNTDSNQTAPSSDSRVSVAIPEQPSDRTNSAPPLSITENSPVPYTVPPQVPPPLAEPNPAPPPILGNEPTQPMILDRQPPLIPGEPNARSLPEANSAPGDTEDEVTENPFAIQPRPQSSARTSTATQPSFSDIPQIEEVREYFQSRWEPPQELPRAVEYRLTLNTDGSIQQIFPIGETAAIFIDRTPMPLLNQPFVSPLEIAENPVIRIVLRPDGKVQAFSEGGN